MSTIKPGVYEHFKGNRYAVIGDARDSETLEALVVYRALYDSEEFGKNTLWVRPKELFEETVKQNGIIVPRFKYIGEE